MWPSRKRLPKQVSISGFEYMTGPYGTDRTDRTGRIQISTQQKTSTLPITDGYDDRWVFQIATCADRSPPKGPWRVCKACDDRSVHVNMCFLGQLEDMEYSELQLNGQSSIFVRFLVLITLNFVFAECPLFSCGIYLVHPPPPRVSLCPLHLVSFAHIKSSIWFWTMIKVKHFMNFEALNWYLFGLVGSCMLFVFLNVFRNFPQDGTLGLLLHGTSVVGFCSEEVADQGWPQPQSRPCSQCRVCLFRRISIISHKFLMYFYPFFTRSNLWDNCSPTPLVVLQPFPSNTSCDSLCQIHLSCWHDDCNHDGGIRFEDIWRISWIRGFLIVSLQRKLSQTVFVQFKYKTQSVYRDVSQDSSVQYQCVLVFSSLLRS